MAIDLVAQNSLATPLSKINHLDPSCQQRVLTAWSAQPVYALSNTQKRIPDGLLLVGQVSEGRKASIYPLLAASIGRFPYHPSTLHYQTQHKNGKTKIVEQTTKTLGEGYAAIFIHNPTTDQFDMISTVYHDGKTGKVDVDVWATGLEGILRRILQTGQDASTSQAIIKGKGPPNLARGHHIGIGQCIYVTGYLWPCRLFVCLGC